MTENSDKEQKLQAIAEMVEHIKAYEFDPVNLILALESMDETIAIYVAPASVVHKLGGGKGNADIEIEFPFRKMPFEFRTKELIEWNRRVLNDTAGDKDMSRSDRVKRYKTAVRNRLTQTHSRGPSVDPLTRELIDTVVRNGTPRKLAKTMTLKTLRTMVGEKVFKLTQDRVALEEQIAAEMKAARK